jgi:two-component system LytT family response regulator
VADICAIAAQDNYTEVQLLDGEKVFLRKSLTAWEATLPPAHFIRVHRTQIVNLARVTGYERDAEEHTLLAVQAVAGRISVSRDRWPEVRDRLALTRPSI